MLCVALEGITLSLMAAVPPSSSRVWVEQQCSLGRLQCCPVLDSLVSETVIGL